MRLSLLVALSLFLTNAGTADDAVVLKRFGVVQQNARLLHLDKNRDGLARLFYQIQWDNDSEEVHVRFKGKEGWVDHTLGNGVDVGTAELGSPPDGRPAYLYYHDHKGQKLRLKITDSPDWPQDQKPELDPDVSRDKRRQLLKLKTETSLPFFSFCYLPDNSRWQDPLQTVILLNGGSGAHTEDTEPQWYLGKPTISFLTKKGYMVILANFRGKNVSNQFRLEGVGRMHDRAILDIIQTLEAANRKAPIRKKNLYVIGHSRGGHMAGLLATRLSDHTQDFEITRTIVVDAGMNRVDDYFKQFTKMKEGISRESLDFVDNDWTHGPLCYRPKGRFTDDEWKKIKEIEKKHFSKFRKEFAITGPYARTKSYFDQSPYHHAQKLQGRMLLLPDIGSHTYPSALQFQKRVGSRRVIVEGHSYGHGFDSDNKEAMQFYFDQLEKFLK